MSSAPEPAPDPSARPSRWLDRLTTALLAAGVSVAVAAAVPELLMAAGVELGGSPWAAEPGRDTPPIAMPHRPPEILAHPDEPEILGGSLFDPDRDPDGDEAPRGQVGLTRVALTLHQEPESSADVVGEIKAGQPVTIPLIVGDWALVYHGGAGGLVRGWAKKSEIAIR
jgi:hypothetical protein